MLLNVNQSDLDKKIYRVTSLERLLALFVSRSNVLVKPALWEDVFENFILRSPVRQRDGQILHYDYHDRMYGQCWSLDSASDAMWRIYSPDKNGLRIRTTIRKLRDSLYAAQPSLSDVRCCVGKVEYLSNKDLMKIANTTFDDSGIGVDDLFRSLLVKRLAFLHEREVRILYQEFEDDVFSNDTYSYGVDPHTLIEQIMIDPRRSHQESEVTKEIIRKTTNFKGEIKRSLLYTLPKAITLEVTDIFSDVTDAKQGDETDLP